MLDILRENNTREKQQVTQREKNKREKEKKLLLGRGQFLRPVCGSLDDDGEETCQILAHLRVGDRPRCAECEEKKRGGDEENDTSGVG